MENRRSFEIILIVLIVCLGIGLTTYFAFFQEKPAEFSPIITPSPSPTMIASGKENDLYSIDLSTQTTTSDTVEIENKKITIYDSGTYTLLGDYRGQIVIQAPQGRVTLRLSGVNIKTETSSAILCEEAIQCTIELVKETESKLSLVENSLGENVIFSKAPLVLRGFGVLNISGTAKTAVFGLDTITFDGGMYQISGIENSVLSKQKVIVKDGLLLLQNTTKDLSENNKFLYEMNGGTVLFSSSHPMEWQDVTSKQRVLTWVIEHPREEKMLLSVFDSTEKEILSFLIPGDTQSILISSPLFVEENYTLYELQSHSGTLSYGIYQGGEGTIKEKIEP